MDLNLNAQDQSKAVYMKKNIDSLALAELVAVYHIQKIINSNA